MTQKKRLDQLVHERGFAESREKAQRLIRAGQVSVDGKPAEKPGHTHAEDVSIEISGPPSYVSRGGLKLEAAFDRFDITARDRICVDVGASTGGFTDCLLQQGAKKVYAVDVGKGQLDWNLRNDERVVVLEGINARYIDEQHIPEQPSFATFDVSFISLTKVLPAVTQLLNPDADLVTLIKPQFEAGPKRVGKGGVVRDAAVRDEVVASIRSFGTKELGLEWVEVITSPLKGPAGNVEFLAHWRTP